jgi:hypothetical protein
MGCRHLRISATLVLQFRQAVFALSLAPLAVGVSTFRPIIRAAERWMKDVLAAVSVVIDRCFYSYRLFQLHDFEYRNLLYFLLLII